MRNTSAIEQKLDVFLSFSQLRKTIFMFRKIGKKFFQHHSTNCKSPKKSLLHIQIKQT